MLCRASGRLSVPARARSKFAAVGPVAAGDIDPLLHGAQQRRANVSVRMKLNTDLSCCQLFVLISGRARSVSVSLDTSWRCSCSSELLSAGDTRVA